MRLKRILFAIAAAAAIAASAQAAAKAPGKSTVHLRNGQFVTGTITERNSERVVIVSSDDNLKYEFAASDIDHISHEAKKKNYDTSKFRGFIDLGYGFGFGSPRNNFWAVETSFGYQITPHYYLGAGLALHNFNPCIASYPMRTDKETLQPNDPDWKYPFIPIYLEGRYNLRSESHNTPFLSLKAGATFINHDGFYASPAIGWHFKAKQYFSFNVSVAYALQTASYKLWCTGDTPGAIPDYSGSSYLSKGTAFHNVMVKAGIEF